MKIIVIGAGAAGLISASELSRKNHEVILLEGRDRIGGRMNTMQLNDFSYSIEEGAEFIHGDLPVSISLIKEAGAAYHYASGKFYHHKDGRIERDQSYIEGDNPLNRRLKSVEADMTVKQFLDLNFGDEGNSELHHSVKKFVEGFDSADYSKMSLLAFRDEWMGLDDGKQIRIDDGYKILYNHLANKFVNAGGQILLNNTVIEVQWKTNDVNVICSDGEVFNAEKVVVTVPTGVLKNKGEASPFTFKPEIPELERWLSISGYGSVIKIIFEFKHRFWENESPDQEKINPAKDMSFVFSEEKIPTWWTQSPVSVPLLTGWLAGPDARRMEKESDESIYNHAMDSLSNIFSMSKEALKNILVAGHVKNWTADPFTRGAYSFPTPESRKIENQLKPVMNTIYFAGDGYYSGDDMGTVEAALLSGIRAATLIG